MIPVPPEHVQHDAGSARRHRRHPVPRRGHQHFRRHLGHARTHVHQEERGQVRLEGSGAKRWGPGVRDQGWEPGLGFRGVDRYGSGGTRGQGGEVRGDPGSAHWVRRQTILQGAGALGGQNFVPQPIDVCKFMFTGLPGWDPLSQFLRGLGPRKLGPFEGHALQVEVADSVFWKLGLFVGLRTPVEGGAKWNAVLGASSTLQCDTRVRIHGSFYALHPAGCGRRTSGSS